MDQLHRAFRTVRETKMYDSAIRYGLLLQNRDVHPEAENVALPELLWRLMRAVDFLAIAACSRDMPSRVGDNVFSATYCGRCAKRGFDVACTDCGNSLASRIAFLHDLYDCILTVNCDTRAITGKLHLRRWLAVCPGHLRRQLQRRRRLCRQSQMHVQRNGG